MPFATLFYFVYVLIIPLKTRWFAKTRDFYGKRL